MKRVKFLPYTSQQIPFNLLQIIMLFLLFGLQTTGISQIATPNYIIEETSKNYRLLHSSPNKGSTYTAIKNDTFYVDSVSPSGVISTIKKWKIPNDALPIQRYLYESDFGLITTKTSFQVINNIELYWTVSYWFGPDGIEKWHDTIRGGNGLENFIAYFIQIHESKIYFSGLDSETDSYQSERNYFHTYDTSTHVFTRHPGGVHRPIMNTDSFVITAPNKITNDGYHHPVYYKVYDKELNFLHEHHIYPVPSKNSLYYTERCGRINPIDSAQYIATIVNSTGNFRGFRLVQKRNNQKVVLSLDHLQPEMSNFTTFSRARKYKGGYLVIRRDLSNSPSWYSELRYINQNASYTPILFSNVNDTLFIINSITNFRLVESPSGDFIQLMFKNYNKTYPTIIQFSLDNLATQIADKTVKNEEVFIFPNPAKNQLHIKTEEPAQVLLYNLTGQLVFSLPVKHSQSVDISTLPPGTYISVIETAKNKSVTKLIVL